MNRRLQRRPAVRENDISDGYQDSKRNSNRERSNEKSASNTSDCEFSNQLGQCKENSFSESTGSKEILAMLQKINTQLEKMQQSDQESAKTENGNGKQPGSEANSKNDSQEQQQSAKGSDSGQTKNTDATKELQAIFSQLLQGKSNSQQPSAAPLETKENTAKSDNGQANEQQPSTVVAQTAAQVLAQAQYELSNELEASLQKLKQVISESEKIANKISNLLGEESSTNKS
ncbi:hypothetical protein HA075_21690 [bacterium BFN5]|nr:hypothetical protein HA075_21690 [bacterium BFN5]